MLDIYLAKSALLVLGMAFAGYWAYQAFDKLPVTLGDGPVLPRYMTQPTQYRFGVILFVGTCLVVYLLIAYFHQALVPIIGAINPELQLTVEKSMKDGSLPYPLIVIFSAAIFISLLKVEKDWNPIFVLRRVVHGWVSIPQIADGLMVMIRDELVVPDQARKDVAGNSDSLYVTPGDFDKDKLSLDRRWAELCYIRLWLERHRAQGSHFTFFNEPSFAWAQLQEEYHNTRARIAPLKRGETADSNDFADVAGRVEALRRRYCRLAACFLVFKNETQKDALRDARQFGAVILPDALRANPLRYTAIFVAAIIVAIYLGVSLSATGWDLLHHGPVILGSEIVTRWILYGLANYGMPIIAVLLLRYLGWRIDRTQPNSYLISYAAIFLVALVVAAVCLAAAQMVAGPGQMKDLAQFAQRLFDNLKWALSPAGVSVYVIYHVDRQIDPMLPNLGSHEHWRLPQRLMSCVFFAILVTGASVVPTLGIPVPQSAWPVEKLQIVILGTTFVVGLTMALVGEFLLVASAPPAAALPEGGDARLPAGISRPNSGRWVIAGAFATMTLTGLGVWMSFHAFDVPQWAFDKQPVYLGERIPLAWTFKLPASTASVHYELESGAAGKFRRETCIDGDHYYVDRINATREWRIRAVTDCDSGTPVSQWSQAIEITQYDSVYQRIRSRGQIDILVSASQDQDFFKWGHQGFDIDLAKLIVQDLSTRMGRELKLVWKSVRWEQLLPATQNRSGDFAISSITKTSWREKKFSIKFTSSYYCTSYALIYRVGTDEGSIQDMTKDRIVGVQRETTSAGLVDRLAANGLFRIAEYDTNESLQNALAASKIDVGVTDTAFAQAAQLDMRSSDGIDRLKFKEFGPNDMPPTQTEQTQEYAIAVHKDEIELLGAINQTLELAKSDGELARLFRTAAEKYETSKNYKRGSRNLGDHPWECFGQTATN